MARMPSHNRTGDLDHDVGQIFDRGDDGTGLFTERGRSDAKEHREDDDLQNLVGRHRFDGRARHEVRDEILERERADLEARRRADVRDRQPGVVAGSQNVDHQEAKEQRSERRRDETSPSFFSPMRPIDAVSPICATPTTSVENTSGAMIILISRRKMSVMSEMYPETVFAVCGSGNAMLQAYSFIMIRTTP